MWNKSDSVYFAWNIFGYGISTAQKKEEVLTTLQGAYAEDEWNDERLEAIAFYEQGGKLTIGCEGWFGEPEEYGYDYDGSYLSNGLEIEITSHTKSKDFLFGVSWLDHCTDENEVQTWFAADPTIANV